MCVCVCTYRYIVLPWLQMVVQTGYIVDLYFIFGSMLQSNLWWLCFVLFFLYVLRHPIPMIQTIIHNDAQQSNAFTKQNLIEYFSRHEQIL